MSQLESNFQFNSIRINFRAKIYVKLCYYHHIHYYAVTYDLGKVIIHPTSFNLLHYILFFIFSIS